MINELLMAYLIVAGCAVFHTGGLVLLAYSLFRWRRAIERNANVPTYMLALMVVLSVITHLHAGEAAAWALVDDQRHLFADYETSL